MLKSRIRCFCLVQKAIVFKKKKTIFIKLELGSHASKRLKDASLLIHYVSLKTAGYFDQFRRCIIHEYSISVQIREKLSQGENMRRKQLLYLLNFLMMSFTFKSMWMLCFKSRSYKDKACLFTCVVCLTKHACKGHQSRRIWLKRQN